MFSFFRRTKVRAITDDDLVRSLHRLHSDLKQHVETLTEQIDRLRAEHLKLRGRVYALWGSGTTPEEAQEPRSLADPRLTKAQVRAALIARGELKPQSQP